MDINRAIKILKKHNEWRRDRNVPISESRQMESPTALGIAIDTVVEYFEETI